MQPRSQKGQLQKEKMKIRHFRKKSESLEFLVSWSVYTKTNIFLRSAQSSKTCIGNKSFVSNTNKNAHIGNIYKI